MTAGFGKMRCWRVRSALTALTDGELSDRRRMRILRHLKGCVRCATLHREIADAVAVQEKLLRRALTTSPEPDVEGMLRRVRARLADTVEPVHTRTWVPVGVGALAVAGVALFLYGQHLVRYPSVPRLREPVVESTGEQVAERPSAPAARLADRDFPSRLHTTIQKGPPVMAKGDKGQPHNAEAVASVTPQASDKVPPDLLARPDLFVDYGIVVRLDALEHFDSILGLPENEGRAREHTG